ncbi:Crp/Fnr family transcriptional regulator [Algoriphagus resistens]|uniref:Crp/Fnr family transcriptional regulator n=1 Tax=Algoriphagus resistens TaxID=1750590 RepID=UPI0007169BBD|nr:Crp/Fnr family transcriptional regulator [Algoriphagus resistens]
MEQLNKFLNYLSAISPISEKAKEAIKNLCSTLHIKKNNNLQSIGQTCRTIYFVVEGTARINYFKEDKDVTEYFAFENDMIIRAESLFTGRPSHKAIQAISDTTFIAIPATPLFELFEKHHEVERLFRKIVERSYVDAINRLESLQFHTAEERYQALIKKSPAVVREIPLKHIASYLGITQVSLSRIRAAIS